MRASGTQEEQKQLRHFYYLVYMNTTRSLNIDTSCLSWETLSTLSNHQATSFKPFIWFFELYFTAPPSCGCLVEAMFEYIIVPRPTACEVSVHQYSILISVHSVFLEAIFAGAIINLLTSWNA